MILSVYEAAAWVVVVKQDNKTRRRQPESIGRQWSCRRICIGGGGGGETLINFCHLSVYRAC